MLASRVLPPILRSQPPLQEAPPIATFFNIPRRYVKSNMQVGDHASSRSTTEEVMSPRMLRKSCKVHDLQSAATTGLNHSAEDCVPAPIPSPNSSNKRCASFNDKAIRADAAAAPNSTDTIMLPSASSTASGELSGHVCLCQPEPKIPRPRNAFILYRQHHQHTIVNRNPGLTNPEISKIIGEQWKAESDEQKKIWQDLAQEEKARHHEQYPDYRYQPRRLVKPGSLPLNGSAQYTSIDKYRCSRCGGRSIKTPTSPFLTSSTPTLPPPNLSEGLTPTTRYLPVMSNLSLESPAKRRAPGLSGLNNICPPSSGGADTAMRTPLTSDAKRRRFNNYPMAVSNGRRPESVYYSHGRRESLPVTQFRQSPPNSAVTPSPRTPRDRRSSLDLNVLVPNQYDQSRSVEAMVMSVPYAIKIKVLGRITPPLREPGPASPAVSVRGALIAIEGDDVSAIKEVTDWLYDHLSKDKEYSPQVAEPPKQPKEVVGEASFEEYLELIKDWHVKSREMIKYITTHVGPLSPPSEDEDDTTKDTMDDKTESPPISPFPLKPVILIPTYQLRAADAYASRVPIQDVYSPMDHWQWMATLWRGTIGPDLTVYVKNAGKDEGNGNGKLVDLNEEARCLTMRRERDGRLAEATLRRAGFEVCEWIIKVGSRKEL